MPWFFRHAAFFRFARDLRLSYRLDPLCGVCKASNRVEKLKMFTSSFLHILYNNIGRCWRIIHPWLCKVLAQLGTNLIKTNFKENGNRTSSVLICFDIMNKFSKLMSCWSPLKFCLAKKKNVINGGSNTLGFFHLFHLDQHNWHIFRNVNIVKKFGLVPLITILGDNPLQFFCAHYFIMPQCSVNI